MIPRYSRPELAAIWDDRFRFELWLEIELSVCEAMEHAGTVPAGTAAQVRAKASGESSVGADQEDQPPRPGQLAQRTALGLGVLGAERAVDHGRAGRQLGHRSHRVGRPLWIGQEKEARHRCPRGVSQPDLAA